MATGLEGLVVAALEGLLQSAEGAGPGLHEEHAIRALRAALAPNLGCVEGQGERVVFERGCRSHHRHGSRLAQAGLDEGERQIAQGVANGAHAGGPRPAAPDLSERRSTLQQGAGVVPQGGCCAQQLVEGNPTADHRLARVVGEDPSKGLGKAQDLTRALRGRVVALAAAQAPGRGKEGMHEGVWEPPVTQQTGAHLHMVDLELPHLEGHQACASRRARVLPDARVALGVHAGEGELADLTQEPEGEVCDGVQARVLGEALGRHGDRERTAPVEVGLERAAPGNAGFKEREPEGHAADRAGPEPHGRLVHISNGGAGGGRVGQLEDAPGEGGVTAEQLHELGLLEVLTAGELEDAQPQRRGTRQVPRQAQLVEAVRPHGQALRRRTSQPSTTTRFRPPALAA